MKWAALITWVVTAGGGFVLLGLWLQGGGMRQRSGAVIRPPLILGHFALAATGLVLWIIYVATDTEALAWIAFALLAIVAALGFTMFAIWLQQRRVAPSAAPAGMGPSGGAAPATAGAGPAPGPGAAPTESAERRFPIPIVAAHGLVAAATLVLVLLTAAGVGES